MTLSELKGDSSITSLFKCDLVEFATVDKISTDSDSWDSFQHPER